ncbi:hypothetical protein D3C87_1464270 [compost metagenome]
MVFRIIELTIHKRNSPGEGISYIGILIFLRHHETGYIIRTFLFDLVYNNVGIHRTEQQCCIAQREWRQFCICRVDIWSELRNSCGLWIGNRFNTQVTTFDFSLCLFQQDLNIFVWFWVVFLELLKRSDSFVIATVHF